MTPKPKDTLDPTYDQIIAQIEDNTVKLNAPEIGLDEAMRLFEQTMEQLTLAKAKLETYKGQIKKVLENNQLEDFDREK